MIDCKANGQVLTHDAGAAFDGSDNPLNIWVSMSCDKTPVVDEVSSNGQDKKQSVLARARDLLSASGSKEEEKETETTLETLIQSLNAEFGEELVSSVRSRSLTSLS